MDTDNSQPIPKQRYYDQQLLTVENFKREQDFHIAYRQLQNQLLLTPGILTGLTIQKGETQGQVKITPGVAIDNSGRVINLTDSAKFNGTKIPVQSGQFSLDLSDQQYHNNKWLLTLEYNQEEDLSTPDQLKEIPKIRLILSTDRAKDGQTALATLDVTTSQTGATSSISIEIDPSISVKAVIAPERIPTLSVDQIPTLPVSKILGSFAAEQIPDLKAEKITSGLFNLNQIPDLPASKIKGSFSIDQIPELDASKITSGTLNTALIPDLPTSKITGAFSSSQIPDLDASKITSGTLKAEQIPLSIRLGSTSQYQYFIYGFCGSDEAISFEKSPTKIIETTSPFPQSPALTSEIVDKMRLKCIYDCTYEDSADHPVSIEIQAKIVAKESDTNGNYMHYLFKYTLEGVETSGIRDQKYATFSGFIAATSKSPDDVGINYVIRNSRDSDVIAIAKNNCTWNVCLTSNRELKEEEEGHLHSIIFELCTIPQALLPDGDK